MLLYLDLAHKNWTEKGRMLTRGDLAQAVHYGAVKRMWSTGAGSDVMKRIAAPLVGGSVTSLALEMLVYPVIFFLWRGRKLDRSMTPTSTEDIHRT